MSIRCIIIFILVVEFLIGQGVDTSAYKRPKTAFLFSLVPGGGQLYNDKWVKAMIFMGLEASATKAWMENSKYYNNLNKYAWWMGFIYLFGMLDAVVDAHLQPFDEIMNTNIESIQKEKSQDEE